MGLTGKFQASLKHGCQLRIIIGDHEYEVSPGIYGGAHRRPSEGVDADGPARW
jgi:hypothetical protein